jgi:hypothetical protein
MRKLIVMLFAILFSFSVSGMLFADEPVKDTGTKTVEKKEAKKEKKGKKDKKEKKYKKVKKEKKTEKAK